MITPDITKLKNVKTRGKNKGNNILNVLENLESVFNGSYFHYKNEPSELKSELKSEESIAETTKLRKQRLDEIVNKEKKMTLNHLENTYTEYSSPSDIYKNLSETIDSEENEAQENAIKDKLANLIEEFKNSPMSDANKIINRNNTQKISNLFLSLTN